jgi:hypothetical protein
MSLAILSSHENEVCLTDPHAFFVYSEHVLKNKLLPRHERNLYDLTEVFDILQLVLTLEKWAVEPWLGCPS